MGKKAVGKGAKIDQRVFVAQVKGAFSISQLNGLFQGDEQMAEAGFARAVGAKDHCQRRKPNRSCILPGLEILDV